MPSKHERIINLLDEHNLDGVLLRQVANFAWATDGAASYVNTASTYGSGTLLITRDSRHLITTTIEAPRFEQEEELKDAGWEFHADPWYLTIDTVKKLTQGLRLGADYAHPGAKDLNAALSVARSYLDINEQGRFKALSRLCAQAMEEAILATLPGMTEHQIAAILARASLARGFQPIVNLVATDERIYRFRHPLPTSKVLKKYAMLVLCGRMRGLVCSITRLVHFGQLPDDLIKKSQAVAEIDARMIAVTRPGVIVADIFQATQEAYARVGYPEEYKLHHQGGPAGYTPRESLATPDNPFPVQIGQAYAWNPSITGYKSEDTILIGESKNQIMTTIPEWPSILVEVAGEEISRPAILVIET